MTSRDAAHISDAATDGDQPKQFPVALWLFVICGLIFCMVVLGGVTRLTHSGLSIVEWRPVTGWLPPLGEAAWEAAFSGYRQSPEYKQINLGMTLAEFQGIFWLEYLHRLLGRIVGLVFFLPFLVFLVQGRLNRDLRAKCGIMFVLGGLQGVLGWYMVKSGLVDEPDVSQYRLAAHLGLALLIYVYIFWTALGIVSRRPASVPSGQGRWANLAAGVFGLAFLTVLSGAFVAGLDAGFLFNTFPLMDGRVFPADGFGLSPSYLNFFEDIATVQFDHRLLAVMTVASVVSFLIMIRNGAAPIHLRSAVNILLLAVILQAAVGVATLVLVVPLVLGALHQAGAVILLSAALWGLHNARR